MSILGSFFSKTSGDCFPVAGSKRSSDRWPASGSMLSGECYQQPPLVLGTGVSASSYWPTATAQDSEQAGSPRAEHLTLHRAATHWATPRASDGEKGGPNSKGGRGDPILPGQAASFSPPAQLTADGPTSSCPGQTLRQRLNPAFACWLMGWPAWWTNPGLTSCVQSEMALYRSRLQQHLSSLLGEPASHEVAA
jgi:hypothetical protein